MSLTQVKDEAAQLQSAEQRELIAFLIALQTEKDEQFRQDLAREIDDTNSGNWIELDELHKRYRD